MFQRILMLRPAEETADDVYQEASACLREAISALLPAAAPALATWPHVDWSSGQNLIRACEWIAAADSLTRLLTTELQVTRPGQLWRISLQVGATTRSEAVVQQECGLEPAPAMFPLHAMPALLSFIDHFACYDMDGMRTGVAYTVQKKRAADLRQYLEASSEERKLPIILVTRSADQTHPLDYRQLALLLAGIAHVICLHPSDYWKKADISATHPCAAGFVRLYRPGYSPRDADGVHPCYQPAAGQIKSQDKLELLDKSVSCALAAMHEASLIEQLMRSREEEQSEKQVQQRLAALQERLLQERRQEHDSVWQDFQCEYDQIVAERDRYKREAAVAHDEIRRLRFQLQQTRTPAAAITAAAGASTPYVTLSARAAEVLADLDPSEWDEVAALLQCLTVETQRKSQSEVCHSTKMGTHYVYPRSKTKGGRRVIYILQGAEVRVCEIYVKHDDYERARNKGWNEADYQETRIWSDNDRAAEQLRMGLLH